MKKVILMFSVMFALVATTFAQNAQQVTDPIEHKQKGKDKMHPKHKHGKKVAKELGLNDEQKKNMKTMNDDFHGRMKAIRSDKSLTKEQKRAKTKELAQSHDANMKKTLTPEQYSKMQEMKKERMAEGKSRRGKRGENGQAPIKDNQQPEPKKF